MYMYIKLKKLKSLCLLNLSFYSYLLSKARNAIGLKLLQPSSH